MPNVSTINLYGTTYSIKDSTARSVANEAKTAADNAQNTANNADSKATTNSTNITKLSTEGIVIDYEQADESINVTKGINLK